MKTQHTPGPWEVLRQGIEVQSDPEGPYYGHEVAVVINGIFCSLCCIPVEQTASNHGEPGVLRIDKGESLANAALIAAAPELLEALEAIIKITDGSQPIDYPGALMIARSAIAKAKGVI